MPSKGLPLIYDRRAYAKATAGQVDAEECREDRRESWFVAAGIGIFLAGIVLGILAFKI